MKIVEEGRPELLYFHALHGIGAASKVSVIIFLSVIIVNISFVSVYLTFSRQIKCSR